MFPGVNREEEEEEEENADLQQQFQVNVTVLEGRHLAVVNANSKITITLGRHRKTSRSKTLKTDSPYFNEFFFFTFYSPLNIFLDEILRVEIHRVRRFKLDKLIGGFSVELATVWLQPNHLFYHKWAALTDPRNPAAGVKGYLKCDIAILAKGSRSKPVSHDLGEEIENHLMVPYGEVNDRQRAKFVFSIFRADNFSAGGEFSVPPDPYVTITFGGVSRRTSVEKKTETPLWNQELVFVDMIPTLYQYVHIDVCDASKSSSKRVLGGAQLDLRKISHESEKGFLPTYGPSFLYFYKNFSKLELHDKCCSLGHSCTYAGRLLMALRTEIVDYAEEMCVTKKRTKIVPPKRIAPLTENRYFNYKDFVFFASVFDVLLFNRRLINNKISVRVTIGPARSTNETKDKDRGEVPRKIKKSKKKERFPREMSQADASSEKRQIRSERSAEIPVETIENAPTGIAIHQNKAAAEAAVFASIAASEASTPIRRRKRKIIRLPKKGFVYVNAQRKRIRQSKFFRSLDEWPEKRINRNQFTSLRRHRYRSGKESKKPSEQMPEQNVSAPQEVSTSKVSRMSERYRNMKLILAKRKDLKVASKSKYLQIKALLKRDRKEGRFTSSALPQTDDEHAKSGRKQSRSPAVKLKEWTRQKRFSRKRARDESEKSQIPAGKPKRKKHIPVHKMNWETSFKKQEFSWGPETRPMRLGNKSGALESDARESEKDKTETDDKNSTEQFRKTKSAYTWLTGFLPKILNHGDSFSKRETQTNSGVGGKSDRRRRNVRKSSITKKFRSKSSKGTTESSEISPNELKTMRRGKFGKSIPAHKMNWETSFKRQEFSWNPKWMREGNSKQKPETTATDGSSNGPPEKWSHRSGYGWLTSLLYRKRDRSGSLSDTRKTFGSEEEPKHSHRNKISQVLTHPRRRREKSRKGRTEISASSLFGECEMEKGTFMSDRKTDWNESIRRKENLAGLQSKPEKKKRNRRNSFTKWEKSETPRTESTKGNPKFSAKMWKLLTRKFHDKPSKRGKIKTVSYIFPEYYKRMGNELWDSNACSGILGSWPENRRRNRKSNTERSYNVRKRSTTDHEERNADRKKMQSPRKKLGWLLKRGNKESMKYENGLSGKSKHQETPQKHSDLSSKRNKYTLPREKSLPPKHVTSSSSYAKSSSNVAGAKRNKVKRVRRRQVYTVEDSDSTDRNDYDFDFVRYPWQRRRPQSAFADVKFRRRKKSTLDAKLSKEMQRNLAEPFDYDGDDEYKHSEITSDDSDRLYTRPKRYHKKKSSKRKEFGFKLCERTDLLSNQSAKRSENESKPESNKFPISLQSDSGKAKMRPFELIKKYHSKGNEKKRANLPAGRQENYFVFYSIEKGRLKVSQTKLKPDKVETKTNKGIGKSKTDLDQKLKSKKKELKNSKAKRKKLKGGNKNGERRDSKEEKGNSNSCESDGQSNTFNNGELGKEKGTEAKANPNAEDGAEFSAEKVTNRKRKSTKDISGQKTEIGLEKQKNKIKRKSGKSNAKSRAEPEDESSKAKPKSKKDVKDGKNKKKTDQKKQKDVKDGKNKKKTDQKKQKDVKDGKNKKKTDQKMQKDVKVKGRRKGQESQTEHFEEKSPVSETSRVKPRNRKGKKKASTEDKKTKKEDIVVKKESKGYESQAGYFDEKSRISEASREKPGKRKEKKRSARAKEEKLKRKKTWLARKRNRRKEWKPLKQRKISDEESDKMTGEIKHLTVYNDCNTIGPQSVKIIRHYGYNDFSGKFPCLHVVGSWPDARRRMYRTNVIQNSIKTFAAGIRDVENELRSENKVEASAKMKNILSNLSRDCKEILRQTEHVEPEDTNLWREKRKFYHSEIREIIFKADTAVQRKVLVPEDELNRSYNYLTTIKRFAQDPEDSFPDTEIWLLKNKRNVAQYRMRTRKIVYSPDASERGSKSGKIQSVIFRGKDGEIMAKLEMFMWFGLGNHFAACKEMLPSGFQNSTHRCPGADVEIPETLAYENFLVFQCRVYVSQAVILQPFDTSGFADPFVRIILGGRYKETQTLTSTLNPVWNEMLVFPDVKVYWPPVYVRDNSIAVTVEVFNFDFASSPELIGRTVIKPVVKLAEGERSSPDFQPRFSWREIRNEYNETGKILIAAELLENKLDEEKPGDEEGVLPIPKSVQPHCVGYRLEVLFWGVRELSKKHFGTRCKVYVALECAGKVLVSSSIKISSEAKNFPGVVQTLDLELPQEDEYKPPLIMKLSQTNAIGFEAFTGKCIIPNVKAFFCPMVDDEEKRKREIAYKEMMEESNKLKESEIREAREKETKTTKRSAWKLLKLGLSALQRQLQYLVVITYKSIRGKTNKTYEGARYPLRAPAAEESLDWWRKYYSSKDKPTGTTSAESLVIYDEELEAQPEFGGFADYIYTFNVTTGKMKKKADKEIFVGKVKAAIKLYRWPLEEDHHETLYGVNIKTGLLKQLPSNTAIKYIVRAYVISCRNLTPKDASGKSDPYLLLKLGKQKISDRKNYISKDVNPVFGKCFEFMGIFPKEHLLSVRVMDHDTLTSDDLIGETRIDLESRYYTRHHASCGISTTYNKTGYNFWRDAYRPTELLKLVCKRSNLSEPIYTESGVTIDEHNFQKVSQGNQDNAEVQALNVLHRWHEIPFRGFHLVPEHIETRALYHPSYPGIEQGKIEMWIDIFPADFRYVPPVIDITPRKPVDMELRAIVWNVENVTLDSTSFLFGEKMSDILVEGWLGAMEENRQSTDVHYRSMNGEGNFNWRFVFPFKYIEAERRMVVVRQNTFSNEVQEMKFPCRLELQVLDNDLFKQDVLGSLNLELSSMPRGAKISTQCNLSLLEEATPKMDLFKIRRTRGWWPFKKLLDEESAEYKLVGKVELELEVLTEEEASQDPAGRGRKEPRALPQPKRPDTSLFWLTNPVKTFKHVIFRAFGRRILLILLAASLIIFLGLGIYALPGYAVKKLLGA